MRALKPRALSPSQYDDVVVLIEYMRDEVVRAADASEKSLRDRETKVAERERLVAQQERDVALRRRTLDAALRTNAVSRVKSRVRRYFGGNSL